MALPMAREDDILQNDLLSYPKQVVLCIIIDSLVQRDWKPPFPAGNVTVNILFLF